MDCWENGYSNRALKLPRLVLKQNSSSGSRTCNLPLQSPRIPVSRESFYCTIKRSEICQQFRWPSDRSSDRPTRREVFLWSISTVHFQGTHLVDIIHCWEIEQSRR